MDQTYLLALALAVLVAIAAVAAMRRQPQGSVADGPESPLGVSTEGMKVCPSCTMGNAWTARSCMSCGAALRG